MAMDSQALILTELNKSHLLLELELFEGLLKMLITLESPDKNKEWPPLLIFDCQDSCRVEAFNAQIEEFFRKLSKIVSEEKL